MASEKTFKVICRKCEKTFHVRFPLTDPQAKGTGDVVIECTYCTASQVVTLPQKHIQEEHLIRGLKGREAEGGEI
ncbi:MAG: hypothetical protein GY737_29285 [Desulfobacteraceae bacterium]|nr:hypothetical protein [Desulfobacteraceae bacterium]